MAYKLTATGESRALRVSQVNDPESAVLSFMYETRDSVEFEEILDETHMDDATAIKIVGRLVAKNYIKEV